MPELHRQVKQKSNLYRIDYNFEYEERLAARHAGYTFEDYMKLPGSAYWIEGDGDDKCSIIVAYRAFALIEVLKNQPTGKK